MAVHLRLVKAEWGWLPLPQRVCLEGVVPVAQVTLTGHWTAVVGGLQRRVQGMPGLQLPEAPEGAQGRGPRRVVARWEVDGQHPGRWEYLRESQPQVGVPGDPRGDPLGVQHWEGGAGYLHPPTRWDSRVGQGWGDLVGVPWRRPHQR